MHNWSGRSSEGYPTATALLAAHYARRDDRNETIIYPKHVHKALRRYLGVENTPGAQRFPFNSTEDFAFFT